MARWNVVSIGEPGAETEVLEDARCGAFLRVAFPPGEVEAGHAFRADLRERVAVPSPRGGRGASHARPVASSG